MLIIVDIIIALIGGVFLIATIYNLSLIPKKGLEIPEHKTTIIQLMIGWAFVTASGIYLIIISLFNNLN